MSRYAIWNKTDPIITPIGEVLTAEQWIRRYPVAGVPSVTVVCAAGEINGGFFGEQGADFAACRTPEDKLAVIEAFEDALNTPSDEPSAEERIAAALEYQVMASLPDETTESV